MAKSIFRVGGAYTRITWAKPATTGTGATASSTSAGVTLAYVDVIRETAPRAVASPQAIQPLDQEYPIEIAFPGALEAGSLEVTFREQWNAEVWNAFYQTYSDYSSGTGVKAPIADLLGIFKAQLENTGTVGLQKLIIDPTTGKTVRTINYKNPVIVNIMVDETVNIGTMTFPKSVQFMYTQREEIYAIDNTASLLAAPTFTE